ncbi:MAG: hypothetical protein ACI83I_001132 [Bacteroidia bacterium]|jgi:hypothetical protein
MMRMRSYITLILLLGFQFAELGTAKAALNVDFNAECLQAQASIYQLKLKYAEKILLAESTRNPDNIVTDYLKCMSSLLKVVTNENEEDYQSFNLQVKAALKQFSAYDGADGYSDFFQQELYFYSSVADGKMGNAISAAGNVRNSYRHGIKLVEVHPDFWPAYKTLGLLKAGFGNLPASYRKLISMLGYNGTTLQGLADIQKMSRLKVVKPEWVYLQKEAKFYEAAVQLYLNNNKAEAWRIINTLTSDFDINPLSAFARANIAEKCKKNEVIIETLLARPTSNEFHQIPYFNFMLGAAKLHRLDADAIHYFKKFLAENMGSSYVKSCYQKMAWNAIVLKKPVLYTTYMNLCKLSGNTNLEEDEQAQREAESELIPHEYLLKARLLFDGGYYEKAIAQIDGKSADDFETTLQKTEYCYRKGRIYDELNQNELAIAYYKAAMITGKDLSQYYASYSALYLAERYESLGKASEARENFSKAMSFKANKEYKKSIEHRAKSGLQRLNAK